MLTVMHELWITVKGVAQPFWLRNLHQVFSIALALWEFFSLKLQQFRFSLVFRAWYYNCGVVTVTWHYSHKKIDTLVVLSRKSCFSNNPVGCRVEHLKSGLPDNASSTCIVRNCCPRKVLFRWSWTKAVTLKQVTKVVSQTFWIWPRLIFIVLFVFVIYVLISDFILFRKILLFFATEE